MSAADDAALIPGHMPGTDTAIKYRVGGDEVSVSTLRYSVSALDPVLDEGNYHAFTLTVERRRLDTERGWAVLHLNSTYDALEDRWRYNSAPTYHEDERPAGMPWSEFYDRNEAIRAEWNRACRFTRTEALAHAVRLAPGITVNNHTVADVRAWRTTT